MYKFFPEGAPEGLEVRGRGEGGGGTKGVYAVVQVILSVAAFYSVFYSSGVSHSHTITTSTHILGIFIQKCGGKKIV